MKQYSAENIRNIALLGHGNSGKTTLADAILFYGKATERIGKTADGTTVMDFDSEERKRKISVSSSVYSLEADDKKLNLLDSPGQFDFIGGSYEVLAAADSALIVLSGKSGLTSGAKQCFERARRLNKSVAFFIGKLDSNHAHFYRVISILTGQYGSVICPVVVPITDGDCVVGYTNLINNKSYKYNGIVATEISTPDNAEIGHMRSIMLEAVASVDECLMEKYFSGEEFTYEETINGLKKGVLSGDICPVFSGVQQTGDAVPLMMDILLRIMPAANDKPVMMSDGTLSDIDENKENSVFVFKTVADPFVGRLSYFKVISGKIKADVTLKNHRTGDSERIVKIMCAKGGKQEDTDILCAGDIGTVSKLGNVLTGDTLSSSGNIDVKPIEFPRPSLSVAVYPASKGDEEKINSSLFRLTEEDPTISVETNNETHELILSACGEQHIDVIVSRLKSKFGAEVVLKKPKIAYRETIRGSIKVQGKHKKQSGGHGQFGDVWIEFEPTDSEKLVFEEKVFGGAVPKNFFPAVEKGLVECAQKGVLAGYPMIGIKATLVDGSYHPVDSSEMAFKTAAAVAFKDGIPKAKPVLLEPIGTLTVVTPDEMLGDVIADINKRRGKIIGLNPLGSGMQEVIGEVPAGEMSDFSTSMRSITQSMATFTFVIQRYEDVPASIAQKIIDEAKKD